jgi:hypothetical protein
MLYCEAMIDNHLKYAGTAEIPPRKINEVIARKVPWAPVPDARVGSKVREQVWSALAGLAVGESLEINRAFVLMKQHLYLYRCEHGRHLTFRLRKTVQPNWSRVWRLPDGPRPQP